MSKGEEQSFTEDTRALEVEQGSLGKEDPCSKRPYFCSNVPESILSINTYYVCKCVHSCGGGGFKGKSLPRWQGDTRAFEGQQRPCVNTGRMEDHGRQPRSSG